MPARAGYLNILIATLVLVMASGLSSAQTPAKEQGTPSPLVVPQPSPTTNVDEKDEGPLVHGFQGVLIETLDGKIVSSQAADEGFNPASSIKLATALVALHTFGPNYRFTTGFWTDGSFDKANGQILGNLYVTGRDPSFHHEHAVMIAQQLNNVGIRSVTGDLVIAPGFTMNFHWSARTSGELLYDTLNSTLRSSEAVRAWTYERTAL